MAKIEAVDEKRWSRIQRISVIFVALVFILVVYFGSAPFVVKAMLPTLTSASEDGIFMKGFELFYWPVGKICEAWPWYAEW